MAKTIWQSLADRAEQLAQRPWVEAASLAAWETLRPQRHHEFMRSLGLDPLPTRCDLKLTEHGEFSGPGYRAQRLAYQLLPDCWGSAALYYPDPLPRQAAPAVLYVCGHGAIGTHHYQYHPAMWARRGYVCLIVDTTEQNDNPGDHPGSRLGRQDAWLALGYTPAGAEVWNAMRALDILMAVPQVDPQRVAVTGVSGGGACSFHLACADPRVRALSTVCGISSAYDAIHNRRLYGHCDCMYPNNIFQRDISEYAALLAPRPALFCFAEHDPLYHPRETAAVVSRTQQIYQLYGRADDCSLCTDAGPHGDHTAFDAATSQWFERHVAGVAHPVVERGGREINEAVTSVFNGTPPCPNHINLLPQLLSPCGTVALPPTAAAWPQLRQQALTTLRAAVFPPTDIAQEEASLEPAGDWRWDGAPKPVALTSHRGQIGGVEIWLDVLTPPKRAAQLVLTVADETQVAGFAIARVAMALNGRVIAQAALEPRVAGGRMPPATASGAPRSLRTYHLRAMALLGTTPIMMTMRDIAVSVDYLLQCPETKEHALYLHGRGDAGIAALYHALLDDRVAGVIIEDTPASHLDGAPLLGVLRAFDITHAIGLMAPRRIALINPGFKRSMWAPRLYERLGCPERCMQPTDLTQALAAMLP